MNHHPSKYGFLGFSKKQKNNNKKKKQELMMTYSDTDNKLFLTKNNWPRFIVVKSASEERPLSKLSPFAV